MAKIKRVESFGNTTGSSVLCHRNVGTVSFVTCFVRSRASICDWFGVRRVVCSRDTVSCYNPKVVQASMGAVLRTQVDYVDLPAWLAACGMPVYGASLQGEPLPTTHCPLPTHKVLLIGNESRGISPEAMAQVTHPVLIPNLGGTAESLNASVAAGILMYYLQGVQGVQGVQGEQGVQRSAGEYKGVQDNTTLTTINK